jgi:membrane protease YdiL (CAAX protease family)
MTTATATHAIRALAKATDQHSVATSVALHILPGLLIGALFVVSAPLAMRMGFPPLFAMVTVGMLSGLGFQLWHLLSEGRKRNRSWSLEGVVLYREPMPLWQYFVWVPLFTVMAFVINGLTSPLGATLLNAVPWLPQWFEMRDLGLLASYSRSALVATFALYLLLNGIAAPLIEEMYFRGYLMPRLSRFGRWTPVLEVALFTVYHIWQPYYWITQFFSMLPVVAAVGWKRNIKLGIAVHMALNIIGGLLLIARVLG